MRNAIGWFPRISVVTPSFNQGAFLRETLASIADQRYPALELIVMDGGSTDDSLDVVKSFPGLVSYWESQSDRGQTHAINKGLAKSTGDILCWLNSDDVFLPGALNAVAHTFNSHPQWDWLSAPSLKFGESLHEQEGFYELPRDRVGWLVHCPISQPSTFWRRSLYERFGGLDESFHFALDYEYWVRFVFGDVPLNFLRRPLSAYRLHDQSKTVAQSEKFQSEESKLRDKYIGQLSTSERSRFKRVLKDADALDEISEAVMLLQRHEMHEARRRVIAAIRRSPRLLFTRTGAASLYRVAANKPRYSG